jgi:hypothetical protein
MIPFSLYFGEGGRSCLYPLLIQLSFLDTVLLGLPPKPAQCQCQNRKALPLLKGASLHTIPLVLFEVIPELDLSPFGL